MNKLLEHARSELKIAGYDIDAPYKEEFETGEDYANACAKNAYKMLEVFSSAGHSGFSGEATLQLFDRLARWQNLTPLTNNPEEWQLINNEKYQSKRNPACFSNDNLKTYYDIDDTERIKHILNDDCLEN